MVKPHFPEELDEFSCSKKDYKHDAIVDRLECIGNKGYDPGPKKSELYILRKRDQQARAKKRKPDEKISADWVPTSGNYEENLKVMNIDKKMLYELLLLDNPKCIVKYVMQRQGTTREIQRELGWRREDVLLAIAKATDDRDTVLREWEEEYNNI